MRQTLASGSQGGGYDRSLFERIASVDRSAVHMLDVQYRMHGMIASFPAQRFYHGALKTPQDNNQQGQSIQPPFRHLCWFDVAEGRSVRTGTSQTNQQEADVALRILKLLVHDPVVVAQVGAGSCTARLRRRQAHTSRPRPRPSLRAVCPQKKRIGIISPYKSQTKLLSDMVRSANLAPAVRDTVEVNTVVRGRAARERRPTPPDANTTIPDAVRRSRFVRSSGCIPGARNGHHHRLLRTGAPRGIEQYAQGGLVSERATVRERLMLARWAVGRAVGWRAGRQTTTAWGS